MTNRLLRLAGLSAPVLLSAPAPAQRTPQLLQNAIEATPLRIAPATLTDSGCHLAGEWTECGEPDWGFRVFDCYGDDDSDGKPDDASACGPGEGRWYFGTGYCNRFVTNDMILESDSDLHRADLAWYWTAGGRGTSERCIVGVFTQESTPCEPDSADYAGWLVDFGTLAGAPDYYYFSNIDISARGVWPAPKNLAGSYMLLFLQDVTSSGACILATCAQPMLWGTGDARGNPHAPGTQGPNQFDDDHWPDEYHDEEECYDDALGVCPDPLGAMAQFWTTCCDICFMVNCHWDQFIDSADVLCYLNLWVRKDPEADFDMNHIVDTRDFILFLDIWADCR